MKCRIGFLGFEFANFEQYLIGFYRKPKSSLFQRIGPKTPPMDTRKDSSASEGEASSSSSDSSSGSSSSEESTEEEIEPGEVTKQIERDRRRATEVIDEREAERGRIRGREEGEIYETKAREAEKSPMPIDKRRAERQQATRNEPTEKVRPTTPSPATQRPRRATPTQQTKEDYGPTTVRPSSVIASAVIRPADRRPRRSPSRDFKERDWRRQQRHYPDDQSRDRRPDQSQDRRADQSQDRRPAGGRDRPSRAHKGPATEHSDYSRVGQDSSGGSLPSLFDLRLPPPTTYGSSGRKGDADYTSSTRKSEGREDSKGRDRDGARFAAKEEPSRSTAGAEWKFLNVFPRFWPLFATSLPLFSVGQRAVLRGAEIPGAASSGAASDRLRAAAT